MAPSTLMVARELEANLAKLPSAIGRAKLLREALGQDPGRALELAGTMSRAERTAGPSEHRRAVVLGEIAVLTDAGDGAETPVVVKVCPSPTAARTTASSWVGGTATGDSPELALAAAVWKQIARLHGVAPSAPAAPRTVATIVGPRKLSQSIATFDAVTWPKDRAYVFGDPETRIRFERGHEVTGRLAAGHQGPLYAIATTDDQYIVVVRVDDTSNDPAVYRLDHDGSDPLGNGKLLSGFLATIKTS